MTVQDFLSNEKIDVSFIETHFDGPYWEKAVSFIESNLQRDVSSLSDKQKEWLGKIREDCVEKRIEG